MAGEISTQQIVNSQGYVVTVATPNDKMTSTAGQSLEAFKKLPKLAQQTESEKAIIEIEYVANGQSSNVVLYNALHNTAKQAQEKLSK